MTTKSLVVFLSMTLCSVLSARAETLEWIRQLGTSSRDFSYSVSADGLGNVYISGRTDGILGETNEGGTDAFISKYDASGTLQWTQQLGTSETDWSYGVSADGLGDVYISGKTDGILGETNKGGIDAFISKYDTSGTLQWTQQLGTSESDWGYGVSADGLGNVYISGRTEGSLEGTNAGMADAFVSKYDASGTLQWTQQLGTIEVDVSSSVSADGLGNVYISGGTFGSLEGIAAGEPPDAFISKYDASGTFQWTRQLGTNRAVTSFSVSADGLGNVYMSGYAEGDIEGTGDWVSENVFISKYDASGMLQWTRQTGTDDGLEGGMGVSADGLGNVYMSGYTTGSLVGTNAGRADAFISKYDASGTLQWTQQLGSSEKDWSRGVSADGLGNVYISGETRGDLRGDLNGTNAGSEDAFVAKFTDLPDPLLGDVNLDGEVNGLDVDPFVEVLLSGPYQQEADMNEDQVVNGLDVDPFVSAVVGGSSHRIPEPSTLLLGLLALGVVGGWRQWSG